MYGSAKMVCYLLTPSAIGVTKDVISEVTDLGDYTSTSTLTNDFTIFLGGLLRPTQTNFFGSVSFPRVYLGTYFSDIVLVRSLLMMGDYSEIYVDYLSTAALQGYPVQNPNSVNFNSTSFSLQGSTMIEVTFLFDNTIPLIAQIFQLLPTSTRSPNRLVIEAIQNGASTDLRLIFTGQTQTIAQSISIDVWYTLQIFLLKPAKYSSLVGYTRFYPTATPSSQSAPTFLWSSLSPAFESSQLSYTMTVGNSKGELFVRNVFVRKNAYVYYGTSGTDACKTNIFDLSVIPPVFICHGCFDDTKHVLLTHDSCSTTCDTNTSLTPTSPYQPFCQDKILKSIPCVKNCTKCQNSSTSCIQCDKGYYLSGSSCVFSCTECTSGTVCTACKDNFSLSQSGSCVICSAFDPDCMTCNTTGCTLCKSQYLNDANKCIAECTSGHYAQKTPIKQCVACMSNCLECGLDGNSVQNCSICADRANVNSIQVAVFKEVQLGVSTCSTKCRDGYFGNISSFACEQCQEGLCITCQDSATSCTRCSTPFLQLDAINSQGISVTVCSRDCISYQIDLTQTDLITTKLGISTAAYYSNAILSKCSACPEGCLSCTSNSYSLCQTADKYHSFKHEGETDIVISNVCKDGFYFSNLPTSLDTYTTCLKCASTCATCSSYDATKLPSPTGEQCTACSGTYYLTAAKQCTTDCGSHYFKNTENHTCTACHEQCTECSGSTADLCLTSCAKGRKQQTDSAASYFSCVLNCSDGFYLSQDPVECLRCSGECKTCQSFSSCLSCSANYFRGPNQTGTSVQCLSDCSTISENDPFDSGHLLGYFNDAVSGNICNQCHPFCSKCNSESLLQCTACTQYQGITYYLQETDTSGVGYCTQTCLEGYLKGTKKCDKCSDNCLTCKGTIDNCASCKSGMYRKVNPSNPTQYTCVDQNLCGDGFFGDRTTLSCLACNSTCRTCSGSSTTCTSCRPASNTGGVILTALKLKEQKCIEKSASCGDGYYQYTDGTLFECKTCDDSCLTCADSSTACTSCKLGKYALDSQCVDAASCTAVFKIPDSPTGVCLACEEGCTKCSTSTSNCSECVTGTTYFLQSKSKCVTVCDSGYFANQSTGTCEECFKSCSKCIDQTETTCQACKPGYYLTSNSECVINKSCPDGFYGDDISNTCKKCDASCITCFNPNNNQCNSCQPGYYLTNHSCKKCMSGCLGCTGAAMCTNCDSDSGYFMHLGICTKVCPSGYFGNKSTSSNCQKCNDNCSTCSNTASNCDTCSSHHFKDASAVCQPCPAFCGICSSGTECSECLVSAFKTGTGTECSNTCGTGKYGNTISKKCESCDASCASCNGPHAFQCLTCSNAQYVIKNGVCLDPLKCTGSYYLTNDKNCKPCDAGCLTCTDSSSNCSLCDIDYYFTEYIVTLSGTQTTTKRCFKTCPKGYLPSSSTQTSSGSSSSDLFNYCTVCLTGCKVCAQHLYQYNDTCLASCPSGFAANAGSNYCEKSNEIHCQLSQNGVSVISGLIDAESVVQFDAYLATLKPIKSMAWSIIETDSAKKILSTDYTSFITTTTYTMKKAIIVPKDTFSKGVKYTLTLTGSLTTSSSTCSSEIQFTTSAAINKGSFTALKQTKKMRLDSSVDTYSFNINGFSNSNGAQMLFDIYLTAKSTGNGIPVISGASSQPITVEYLLLNAASSQEYTATVVARTSSASLTVDATSTISTSASMSKSDAMNQISTVLKMNAFTFQSLDEIAYTASLFYNALSPSLLTSAQQTIKFQQFFDAYDSLNGNYESTCNDAFFCNGKGTCSDSKSFFRKCTCQTTNSGANCQYDVSDFNTGVSLKNQILNASVWKAVSITPQDVTSKLQTIAYLSIAKDILSFSDLRLIITEFKRLLAVATQPVSMLSTIQDTILNLLWCLSTSSSTLTTFDKTNIEDLVNLYEENLFKSAKSVAGNTSSHTENTFVQYEMIYLNSESAAGQDSSTDSIKIASSFSGSGSDRSGYDVPVALLSKNLKLMYLVSVTYKFNMFSQFTSYNQFSTTQFNSVSIIDGNAGVKIDISAFDTGMLINLRKPTSFSPLATSSSLPVYRCTYLEPYTNKWVESGCKFESETKTQILCRCTHLTTFNVQSIPFNIKNKPSMKDILVDNGWNSLKEFYSNTKDDPTNPDIDDGGKTDQPTNVTASIIPWFPNPVGLIALISIILLFSIVAFMSIWVVGSREKSHSKLFLTYHPLASIAIGENSMENTMTMKCLQVFLDFVGIFLLSAFMNDMSTIGRAVLAAIITHYVHMLIFCVFNVIKSRKVQAAYPNRAYLSELDQINLTFMLRQFKFYFYLLAVIILAAEGIVLSMAGNNLDLSENDSLVQAAILGFVVVDLIVLELITFILSNIVERTCSGAAYIFKMRGYYDYYQNGLELIPSSNNSERQGGFDPDD